MGNNSVPKFIFRLSRFPVYRGSVLGRFYCIMDSKDTALLCALLLWSGKLKKESTFGHCNDESNINEKKIPVSTRALEEITIKFRCIRIVAKKATICFVMSTCQFARPRETAHFPVDRLL